MEVTNRIFYHIHRTNWRHSEEWVVGNSIYTGSHEYNYYFQGLLDEHHTRSYYNHKEHHLVDKIKLMVLDADKYHEIIKNSLSPNEIRNLKFFNMEIISSLEQTGEYLEQSLKAARELVFEQVRQKYYPDLPSRLHCVWLCEREEINVWWKEFEEKEDKYILEVSATGKVFKGDGAFITHDVIRLGDFFSLAKTYWNGKDFPDLESRQPETLFEGNLKILKRFGKPCELTNIGS